MLQFMMAEPCPRCTDKSPRCPTCHGLGQVCKPVPLSVLVDCLVVDLVHCNVWLDEEQLKERLQEQDLKKGHNATDAVG